MKITKKQGTKRLASTDRKHKKKKKLRGRSSSSSSSGSSSGSSSTTSTSSNSSSSTASSTSSSSGTSSSDDRRKKDKKRSTNKSKSKSKLPIAKQKLDKSNRSDKTSNLSTDVPLELMEKSKTMAPLTKEQWEKQQSVMRRVYDESSGRHRLIKGDGEVIEEIVSKERHKGINQMATKGDGEYFQRSVSAKK